MTTGTQKQAQTQDTKRVCYKPYSQKRLAAVRSPRLEVSTPTFCNDLHIFDSEMKEKYTNKQIASVLQMIFRLAAEKIIKNLWRMPFPHGVGTLYMKEVQITNPTKIDPVKLLRDLKRGMKGVRLKWNKDGRQFPYKNLWSVKASRGFFTNCKLKEIKERADDPTKKRYRAHII